MLAMTTRKVVCVRTRMRLSRSFITGVGRQSTLQLNVKTARERMRTKHGLRPCYVTVAGDVALVLVCPLILT